VCKEPLDARMMEYDIRQQRLEEGRQPRRQPNRDPQGYIYGPSYPYR
jgi:hypothetical protein